MSYRNSMNIKMKMAQSGQLANASNHSLVRTPKMSGKSNASRGSISEVSDVFTMGSKNKLAQVSSPNNNNNTPGSAKRHDYVNSERFSQSTAETTTNEYDPVSNVTAKLEPSTAVYGTVDIANIQSTEAQLIESLKQDAARAAKQSIDSTLKSSQSSILQVSQNRKATDVTNYDNISENNAGTIKSLASENNNTNKLDSARYATASQCTDSYVTCNETIVPSTDNESNNSTTVKNQEDFEHINKDELVQENEAEESLPEILDPEASNSTIDTAKSTVINNNNKSPASPRVKPVEIDEKEDTSLSGGSVDLANLTADDIVTKK